MQLQQLCFELPVVLSVTEKTKKLQNFLQNYQKNKIDNNYSSTVSEYRAAYGCVVNIYLVSVGFSGVGHKLFLTVRII